VAETRGASVAYEEKTNFQDTAMRGRNFTWCQNESLRELLGRREEIEARHEEALDRAARRFKPNQPLLDVLSDALDEDDDSAACAVCHL
jgi:hypothetical protein